MGFIFLYALNIGRLGKMYIALFFAAAALLMFNPKLLRDDIGFQLSFLAILGTGLFYEKWKEKMGEWKILRNKPGFILGVADIFLMTLTAQIMTMPIIAYNFKSVSLIAPFANILALWVVPFVFISLLSGLVLSFLIAPLSFLFFLPAKIFLWYLIKVAVISAAIPWSSIPL
jgi:competence protein ComEC